MPSRMPVSVIDGQMTLSVTLFLGLAFEHIGDLASEADQVLSGRMLGGLPVFGDDRVEECRARPPHEPRQIAPAEGHTQEEVAAVPIGLAAVGAERRPGEPVQHLVAATVASPQRRSFSAT